MTTRQGKSGGRAFRLRRRPRLLLVVLVVVVLVAPFVSLGFGAAAVPFDEAVRIVLGRVTGQPMDGWEPSTVAIIWLNRLPRIITAYGVGAILGVCGVAMQAVIRNPLAEPYVLGVSSGASAGAATAVVVLGSSAVSVVSGSAFVGSLTATALVIWLGTRGGATPLRLVLAGLATGFAFQALTNLVIVCARSAETAQSVVFWNLGSLARTDLSQATLLLLLAAVLVIGLWLSGPYLDAMASGDDTCIAIGIDPHRLRVLLLIPLSAAVAFAVAASGGIGFVGLVVPHLLRPFVNHRHRPLVLATALVAAVLLLAADTLARTVLAPAEIPLGIVTAVVGAPFLMLMISRPTKGLQ